MEPNEGSDLDLIRRRVELIGEVSALTSRALKLTQALAGIDMDILRIELQIARGTVSEELAQELQDTERGAEAMREAQAACAEEIDAAEAEVAAIDRRIAAARGG